MLVTLVKIVISIVMILMGVFMVVGEVREHRKHSRDANILSRMVSVFSVSEFLFDLLFYTALTIFGCGWLIYLVTHAV